MKIANKTEVDTVAVSDAIAARNARRKNKNFAESDRIRDDFSPRALS
jgi:cysteinyl-tRNA synthetase